ncbi:MAG: efflux RND transporter permease subunit [Candidatus Latescibacterota bacterium]|nr:MAG: efflux RND transporter permease subunit [Candidatus Latescibacterota bacterium]
MKTGIAGRLAKAFIDSKLTPLLLIAALLVGLFGTLNTPREEEPQIVVPLVDIFVPYRGATAREVEERITKPLEKIISQIHGVEYIYSMSRQDFAILTVRYYVGEDMEDSLVKLWATILKHMDRKPPGVDFPLLKTTSIDDVPVLTLTLWSERYDAYQLRRVGAQLAEEIKKIDNVSEVDIKGGLKRQVRVILDQAKLEAHRITPIQISQQIQAANQQLTAGNVQRLNREYIVRTGEFLEDAEDVANLVVGVSGSHPVYLRDVAEIQDGPADVDNYVFFGQGPSGEEKGVDRSQEYPAVTLAVAKRKGSDAMRVADQVTKKIEALRRNLLPSGIYLTETRNYGETASEKVFTLLEHLLGAVIAVTIVVGLFLGWRGGLVVFASVPITFALTLFVYYLFGYTLNRVTLFALIFVTGIVVDDSIIVAENVHRHFLMRRLPPLQSAIAAISEVGNPTILATFTVIASVLPMAFVSGLMGPYMSPMPIGASLAMLFSLLVALVGTPWLAYRLLKRGGEEKEYSVEDTLVYRFYTKTLAPLLDRPKRAWISIIAVCVLLLLSVSFFLFRFVEVKILPYDNKSEMQVIIDMPEGTTLEQTARVAKDISAYLKTVSEVTHYQYYVGTNAPINFNGLVRHYYLREGPTVADIQVNLVRKGERNDQSHDIAKRLRPRIQEIAAKYGARVKVAEVPPGPPVLSTLVAEIYGPDYEKQIELARQVRGIFESTEGVVDVDWLVEDDQKLYTLVVDKEKAALRGVNTEQVAHSLRMALSGSQVALLRAPTEIEPVGIELRLARKHRTSVDDLGNVYVRSRSGDLIPVADVVQVRESVEDKAIYRKNLQRVVYVTGDVAGAAESPIYAMLDMNKKLTEIELPDGHTIKPLYTHQPFLEEQLALKWDGEWQITYEVFRDLGGAFAVVLVIIYLLTIGWFQSFKTPLVMMIAIPLSLVGIIPGHWIHGAFFTATSMIGMIALAGIMVRNSVLIIDFIQLRRADGSDLKQAVIESGAVRTRPILLTAGTVVIGAIVILFDPIFQGLAISLMWGAIASTALTLGVVPLVYYMVEKRKIVDEEQTDTAKT